MRNIQDTRKCQISWYSSGQEQLRMIFYDKHDQIYVIADEHRTSNSNANNSKDENNILVLKFQPFFTKYHSLLGQSK